MKGRYPARRRAGERGLTIFLVAMSLTALLGVMALAIDLGMLYVARSQAQRAADAAALAGANVFISSGCTSVTGGCVVGGPQEAPAAAQAITVAAKNNVMGQPADVKWAGTSSCPTTAGNNICFSYPTSTEPQITVTVRRPGIQTIFAHLFGVRAAEVDATATAEAFNPVGNNNSQDVACVTPFLVPNCDPNNVNGNGGTVNPACPTTTNGDLPNYFVDPGTDPPKTAVIEPSATGEQWFLHWGSQASDSATPSEWYMIQYDNFPGFQSGSLLRQYISQCSPVQCGQTLYAVTGQNTGNIGLGVDALINIPTPPIVYSPCSGDPVTCDFSQGQDQIFVDQSTVGTTNLKYTVEAGQYNPLVLNQSITSGQQIGPTASNAMVTAAVYSGAICPQGSNGPDCIGQGGGTVKVQGFMQIFVQGVTHQGKYDGVEATIINVTSCGNPTGTPTPVVAEGGSPIPIRLIQAPDTTP